MEMESGRARRVSSATDPCDRCASMEGWDGDNEASDGEESSDWSSDDAGAGGDGAPPPPPQQVAPSLRPWLRPYEPDRFDRGDKVWLPERDELGRYFEGGVGLISMVHHDCTYDVRPVESLQNTF